MKRNFPSQRLKKFNSNACGLKNFSFLLKKAQEKKEKGSRLIDCSLGETSFKLLPFIKKAGKNALNNDENAYTRPFIGLNKLRKGLATSLKNEGVKVFPENIIVTAGCGTAVDLFFRTFINTNDEVIIFDPFYPPFLIHCLAYGGKPVFVNCYNNGFIPSIKAIKKKINKKTKAIVVNSPNNPTGAIYPNKVLKEIIKIARKNDLLILSDEVYRDFIYEGEFISVSKLYPEKTIVLRSFSKKYCMMGYKVGYAFGSRALIKTMELAFLPMHSGPRISEIMAIEALKHSLSKNIINDLKKKRDYIYENLKDVCNGLVKPTGAFYFYLEAPNNNAFEFSLELLKKNILVAPAFSRKNKHFRISYANINNASVNILVDVLKKKYLSYNKQYG